MTITNGYTTLHALKARLDIEDAQDDSQLESVIEAASRWIDRYTGRVFFGTTETRKLTADDPHCLIIPDITVTAGAANITSVKLDEDGDRTHEVTLDAAADYYTFPDNPISRGGVYEPIIQLDIDTLNGSYTWPVNIRRGVEINATWGYSSTAPKDIQEACLLLSARIWKRKDAIFGVAGTAGLGVQPIMTSIKADPDIAVLLRRFVRAW